MIRSYPIIVPETTNGLYNGTQATAGQGFLNCSFAPGAVPGPIYGFSVELGAPVVSLSRRDLSHQPGSYPLNVILDGNARQPLLVQSNRWHGFSRPAGALELTFAAANGAYVFHVGDEPGDYMGPASLRGRLPLLLEPDGLVMATAAPALTTDGYRVYPSWRNLLLNVDNIHADSDPFYVWQMGGAGQNTWARGNPMVAPGNNADIRSTYSLDNIYGAGRIYLQATTAGNGLTYGLEVEVEIG